MALVVDRHRSLELELSRVRRVVAPALTASTLADMVETVLSKVCEVAQPVADPSGSEDQQDQQERGEGSAKKNVGSGKDWQHGLLDRTALLPIL